MTHLIPLPHLKDVLSVIVYLQAIHNGTISGSKPKIDFLRVEEILLKAQKDFVITRFIEKTFPKWGTFIEFIRQFDAHFGQE